MRVWIVTLSLLLSTQLQAGQDGQGIYRWTDENGLVHYGTRPPDGNAQRIPIRNREATGNANAGMTSKERAERRRRMLESYQRERELKEQAQQRQAEQDQRKAERCKQLTLHWKQLNFPGPVYMKDEQGERRYLDEQQRQAKKDALAKHVVKACGKIPEL